MPTEGTKTREKAGGSQAQDQPKDKRAEYLTTHQLAEVLQVSEATIHRLRRAGRIPAVLLTDRLIRFNLRDVQRALRPHLTSGASDGNEAESEPTPQLSFDDLCSDFTG